MYIQKNEDFIGIQELTFDEVGLISGGDGKKKKAPKKKLSQELKEFGESATATGAATAATGAVVALADTPLPGPADVVGAGFIGIGAVTTAIGAVSFAAGSVLGLFGK